MPAEFHFTFSNLERQLSRALEAGYSFVTCEQYVKHKQQSSIACEQPSWGVNGFLRCLPPAMDALP